MILRLIAYLTCVTTFKTLRWLLHPLQPSKIYLLVGHPRSFYQTNSLINIVRGPVSSKSRIQPTRQIKKELYQQMKEKRDNWSDSKVLRGTRMENKIQTMDGMYSDSEDFCANASCNFFNRFIFLLKI